MSAVISDCGQYRYLLQRELPYGSGAVLFVMLNPSTADGTQDDPTIRRCKDFTRRFGAKMLEVVNLYAFRATDPKAMFAAPDPIGPQNDTHIIAAANRAKFVVAAWGAHARGDRYSQVMRLLDGHDVFALGVTKHGAPRHPLYVSANKELEPFA